MFVFFPEEPKIGIKTIKTYCQRMQEENITRAIIVVQVGMTPSAKQVRSLDLVWFGLMLNVATASLVLPVLFGGKYVLLRDTTRRPEWGSNLRPLDSESEALTTRPKRPLTFFGSTCTCETDKFIRSVFELHHEILSLRGFRPGWTQAALYSHRRWLEAGNF